MAPAKKAAAKKATSKKATKKATKKAAPKRATKKATKKATSKKGTKKGTKKAASSRGGAPNVVVASKAKEAVKGHGVRMSSDFVEGLNKEVNELIAKAAKRAQASKRSTVRSSDL